VVLIARSDSISAGGLIFNPKPWLLVGAGVFVFSLLLWLPLVRGITRTLARMMHATRQIADGRFDVRLGLNRRDEIGSLAESIDQMAARLDGLVKGQKRFLGDIAHELCSPLARLQMALGILEQRATGEEAAFVRAATEKAEQIAALVGELLSFSKAAFGASAVRLQPVNVAAVVAEAVRREETEHSEIQVDVPAELEVSADADLLTRAVANLLRNSLRHASSAGPITIHAERAGEEVHLAIADGGPGVPEEELPRIFDAFYRVDASRTRDTGGTGLGLAIVKTCVESCCGSVTARNREPHGLEVRITLHVAAPEPVPAASA
jgi:two-component system sensor histidine kinase CpxA